VNTIPNVKPNVLSNVFNNVDPGVFLRLGPELMLDWDMEQYGPEVVVDGDMEKAGTADWAAGSGGVLSKETGYEGQALRIGMPVSDIFVFASQTPVTIGQKYYTTGLARTSGQATMKAVAAVGGISLGTVADTAIWTPYSGIVTAINNVTASLQGNSSAPAGAGEYVEWDNVSVRLDKSTAWAWTAFNNADLTKESDGGTGQVLQVAYNGTNNPRASQPILTIGKKYYFTAELAGDGVSLPQILVGNNTFSGLVSTTPTTIRGTVTAASTTVDLRTITSIAGFCQFDNVSVKEVL
jgi:hypothetical protein